jgi:hypothetical protein
MKLSTLAVSLIAALGFQAAQAGTITVIVDDFNSGLNGTFAVTSGSVSGTVFALTPTNGVFSVSANAIVGGGATLTYTPGVTVPSNGYAASLSYDMIFSNLGNPNTTQNEVIANGSSTQYGFVGGPGGNPPVTTAVAYTSASDIVLNFVDNRALSWDLAIDNIKITFQCNGAEDQSFSSIRAYAGGSVSCVPVPGSMGLLGLGGVALALAARRRKSV